MISICVPYWERQAWLDRMLVNLDQQYSHLQLEVSVCDDGSPTPAVVPSWVLLTTLPGKDIPLNPCIPINHAVAASSGNIIVLTNPEIEHTDTVLDEMLALLGTAEDRRYVVARCKDKKTGQWLAGPDVDYTTGGREPVPPGGHFHFLAMMYRSLWNEVGGFDEDYRWGQACDDNDWLWRLAAQHVTFVHTAGVVTHLRGPKIKWDLPHNRQVLYDKWPIVCRYKRWLTLDLGGRLSDISAQHHWLRTAGDWPPARVHRGTIHGNILPSRVVPVPGYLGRGAASASSMDSGGKDVGGAAGRDRDHALVERDSGDTNTQRLSSGDSSLDAGSCGPVQSVRVCDATVSTDSRAVEGRRSCLLHPEWAIVLGGGSGVWDDVLAWEKLYGKQWDGVVVCCNDVGSHWPRPLDHWCTLHPEKMVHWMAQRAKYGFCMEFATWGRKRRGALLANKMAPWPGGSSGMLAVQLAQLVGCKRAILCGIPMTPTPHFSESLLHQTEKPWSSVAGHWRSWGKQAHRMRGWARSMSGRTEELLGTPTLAWLLEEDA